MRRRLHPALCTAVLALVVGCAPAAPAAVWRTPASSPGVHEERIRAAATKSGTEPMTRTDHRPR